MLGVDVITKEYMELFRSIIHTKLGIYYPPKKDYLLKSKLEKIIRKTGVSDVADFYRKIKDNDHESIETLIRYITTNHTFFFREKEHFDILCRDIKHKKLRSPVIWCAGCATGEEVYSISITLFEHEIFDFKIVATDIDRDVLHFMKHGVYVKKKLEYTSKHLISQYFVQSKLDPEKYKVKEMLKKNLIIKRINLVDNLRFEGLFDYIFCRNVMIYFDDAKRKLVIKNLLNNLRRGGWLFIGHSESFVNIPFKLTPVGTSVYRKG